MANKVQFGLKSVYYAKKTSSGYSTPVAIPGAVSLTLSALGDPSKFYADNSMYFHTVMNNGYDGTLEVAKLPDAFLKDIFGFTEDTAHVLIEDATLEPAHAALLFQIDGDADDECYVIYDCSFGRPAIGSSTTTTTKDPTTQSIPVSAAPLSSGVVAKRTTAETTSTVKSGWFSSVYTA